MAIPIKSNVLEPGLWIDRYGNYLISVAMIKVGNSQIAEDLVQETFISAIQARENFRHESSEKTWLAAILKNKIIDYYRKKDILKNTSDYLNETSDSFDYQFFDKVNGHWTVNAAPASSEDWADSSFNKVEFEKILYQCVQKLPEKLRAVFIAKFLDEEDSEIICKVHQISTSNYWVIIHRTKIPMRSCLEKKGGLSI